MDTPTDKETVIHELTKLEAVNKLDTFDHVYLTVAAAREMAAPFGIKITPQRQVNNPTAFKGLNVPGAHKGQQIQGYDAADLAESLCLHEGVDYASMHGRGSRLHECCRALRVYLTKQA